MRKVLRDVVRKAARIALPIRIVHGTGNKKYVTERAAVKKRAGTNKLTILLNSQYHTS